MSGRAAKAAGIGATAASNEVLPPALRRLHDYFTYLVDEVGNLAIVAGMQRLGGPRSYVTYGHRTVDRTIVATKDDIFQIGSQSKLLLALLFIVLAKKDRIELDHPVRQFAPVDLDERITIRHLLMNQSGLGEFTRALDPCRLDPRIIYEPRDLIALARPQGQLFAPGQCFDYCNTGWVVAAMAAERITGQGYAAAIDEHVLAPLGLGRTAIGNPPPQPLLRGYVRSAATEGFIDTSEALSWAYGAGAGYSSIDDMLALYAALATPGAWTVGIDDLVRELGTASERPFFALSRGVRYGLGIEVRNVGGTRVIGHPGSTFSYKTSTWFDSDAQVIVTSCLTRAVDVPTADEDYLYPRAQFFGELLHAAQTLSLDA